MSRVCLVLVGLLPAGTLLGEDAKTKKRLHVPEVVINMPDGHLGPCGPRVGVVTAIGTDSITVEFPESYQETAFKYNLNKELVRKEIAVYPPVRPQELKLEGPFAQGKFARRTDRAAYRITDIRVGDRVIADRSLTQEGVWTCRDVQILRRPNGKVPKAPHDEYPKIEGYEWHEFCQAHQDFEEKGTPIPARFLRGYRDRIAPMPRELLAPRIPAAKP